MKQNANAKLWVNKQELEMNPFVNSFVADTTIGAINSLKGVDYIKSIDMKIDKGEVSITVNNEDIPLTPFPNDIIANTFTGLVSTLKGADDIKQIEIRVDGK